MLVSLSTPVNFRSCSLLLLEFYSLISLFFSLSKGDGDGKKKQDKQEDGEEAGQEDGEEDEEEDSEEDFADIEED